MEMSMAKTHNSIDYIEWPVSDTAAIKAFYAKAFGWAFTDYGPTYAALDNAGIDGGFQAEDAAAKPLVIIYSLDLEHSLEEVVEAGGVVSKPIFEFPGGRRFHFKDPSGNELAVWSDR